MGGSQRGATGEKAVSRREAGERHRAEDTEETEDTEVVWVTLSGEAKREAPAQTEPRHTCAETSCVYP